MVSALLAAGAVSRATAQGTLGQPIETHEQWQPQIGAKTRGSSSPSICEMLGRAAVPVLAELSKQTGVTLQVAPENLDTLGERKLTIIAQGCTLRALMIQIPKALQECHWDIETREGKTAYLLHRELTADERIARLLEQDPKQAEHPAQREARVELARRALTMSPEELAELEKTDLYLARSLQDPQCRFRLELFLSLPEKQMQEFLDTGESPEMHYVSAPEQFRTAAQKLIQEYKEESKDDPAVAKMFDILQKNIDQLSMWYTDSPQSGEGALMYLHVYASKGGYTAGRWAVWPQYPTFTSPKWNRQLFTGTGTANDEAADELAKEWKRRGEEAKKAQAEEVRRATWHEPRNPVLKKEVTLPFTEGEPLDIEQFVAKETGLSVVADYFTTSGQPFWDNKFQAGWGHQPIPREAQASLPLWHVLNLLSTQRYGWKNWSEAGDCLVFRDPMWYRKALDEIPETLLSAYREKLVKQGAFTLDEVASFAVELDRRQAKRPEDSTIMVMLPQDLEKGGLGAAVFPYGLLMYAQLSPEQRAEARKSAGLPYAEMTKQQRQLVKRVAEKGRLNKMSAEAVSKAVFRITAVDATGGYSNVALMYEFPSGGKEGSRVRVKTPGRREGMRTRHALLPARAAARSVRRTPPVGKEGASPFWGQTLWWGSRPLGRSLFARHSAIICPGGVRYEGCHSRRWAGHAVVSAHPCHQQALVAGI